MTTDMEPRYWRTFCEAMGKPEFADMQMDPTQRDKIRSELAAIFATRTRDDWLRHLSAAGTQFAPVNTLAEALDEPHFLERGMVIALDAPDGPIRQAGPPVRLGPFTPPKPAVMPGTHTAEVLRSLGLSETEITKLSAGTAPMT